MVFLFSLIRVGNLEIFYGFVVVCYYLLIVYLYTTCIILLITGILLPDFVVEKKS